MSADEEKRIDELLAGVSSDKLLLELKTRASNIQDTTLKQTTLAQIESLQQAFTPPPTAEKVLSLPPIHQQSENELEVTQTVENRILPHIAFYYRMGKIISGNDGGFTTDSIFTPHPDVFNFPDQKLNEEFRGNVSPYVPLDYRKYDETSNQPLLVISERIAKWGGQERAFMCFAFKSRQASQHPKENRGPTEVEFVIGFTPAEGRKLRQELLEGKIAPDVFPKMYNEFYTKQERFQQLAPLGTKPLTVVADMRTANEFRTGITPNIETKTIPFKIVPK